MSCFYYGFSQLSMLEFFVFRKTETCETNNHPLCGCASIVIQKSPFRIEGTRINYPVMSTPEEPEFYLHRDFYRQESYSGTPFIGQDYQAENLILMLFGHHMRNGTMFSDLMKYRDNSFWDNHRTIQFDTLYEKRKYEIFAVGYAPSASEAEQYMRFYSFTGSSGYQEYIQLLKEEALYETGIWPERAPLLLLITCSYQETDGRFFVAGCLKEE